MHIVRPSCSPLGQNDLYLHRLKMKTYVELATLKVG